MGFVMPERFNSYKLEIMERNIYPLRKNERCGVISIASPELLDSGDWFCKLEIVSDSVKWRGEAGGVDPMQALSNSFSLLYYKTAEILHDCSWLPNSAEVDFGFLRPITTVFGKNAVDRLNQIVDEWEQKELALLEKGVKEKSSDRGQ